MAGQAAEAGADVIVAQGTEGGGHVGWMSLSALGYGADGVLLGTRFLASEEAAIHANYKRAIVESDGHDTVLTEIPDIAAGMVWPGAMSRVQRNRFMESWTGREWALRRDLAEVARDSEGS